MRALTLVWVASIGLVAAACVSTSATALNPNVVHPAVDPNTIVIYRSADQVKGKYEEVALLTSTGDAQMTNESQMLKSMRKEAAKLGANAIILNAETEPGTAANIAHTLIGSSANRQGKALAIFVFPPAAESPKPDSTAKP